MGHADSDSSRFGRRDQRKVNGAETGNCERGPSEEDLRVPDRGVTWPHSISGAPETARRGARHGDGPLGNFRTIGTPTLRVLGSVSEVAPPSHSESGQEGASAPQAVCVKCSNSITLDRYSK